MFTDFPKDCSKIFLASFHNYSAYLNYGKMTSREVFFRAWYCLKLNLVREISKHANIFLNKISYDTPVKTPAPVFFYISKCIVVSASYYIKFSKGHKWWTEPM